MTTYEAFESLPVWQNAAELARIVYKITAGGNLGKDFGLKDQIQRSAVSVSSNIAEGFERGTRQELVQYLYISRGSCGELRSQVKIAKDIGFISQPDYEEIHKLCLNVSRQINGFIEYLKVSNMTGQKFVNKKDKDRREFMEELRRITENKQK